MIIKLENICKTYESKGIRVTALRNINLEIGKGEFSALAGPSGSGKTTLLNIIGGLDTPTGGTASLGGTILNHLGAKALSDIRLRKIGFVFQAYNLIPVLSALENVEYVLLLQGLGRSERMDRARAVLEEVGLKDHMHRRPHELSGGQQQRVAVARAVVSEPDVVLADEPTANLDQKTGARLLNMMRELNRKKEITFLFSTHDMMVMERADRLIRLVDGRITGESRNG